jgi:hypothetical protein
VAWTVLEQAMVATVDLVTYIIDANPAGLDDEAAALLTSTAATFATAGATATRAQVRSLALQTINLADDVGVLASWPGRISRQFLAERRDALAALRQQT